MREKDYARMSTRSRRSTCLSAVLIMFVLLGIGCALTEKPQAPSFNVTITVPITDKIQTMEEIVEDNPDFLTLSGDIVTFAIERDIDPYEVGDDLSIEPPRVDERTDLGDFKVDSPGARSTPAITLREIAPSEVVEILENPLLTGSVPVPRLTFQIDRDLGEFDEYEFVALSSSEEEDINKIDITVRNNLIIPLGRITIDLIDDISTDTIGTVGFNEVIPPGGSDTSRLDLAGKTFTNDLSIFIDAEIPEATVDLGEPDLLESSFVVETFITALQVDSASAKIPQQEFDGSTTISVPDIFVTRAVIGSGSISLEIVNRLPIGVERFIVQFPDFEKDGAVLSVDLSFERNVTRTQNIVLDNTVFAPLQSDAIRVQWDVLTEDTGEEFRTLSRGDFVTVTSEPSKIIFDEVSGKPAGLEVEIPETKKGDIDIPDGLDNVQFETASFVLSFFKNNGPFGLPLSLDLTVKGTNKGGNEGFLIIDETIGPGDTTLTVAGPDVAAFLNLLPTDVEASGMALLGDGFTEVTINKDDVVSGRFKFSTPLSLTITDTTRIEVDPEDVSIKDEESRNKIRENVLSGSIVADVDNSLPLGIGVQINIAHDTTKIFSDPELVIPEGRADSSGSGTRGGSGDRAAYPCVESHRIYA